MRYLQIRPPTKIDSGKRIARGTQKAHRWRLDIPASVTGTRRERKFFRSYSEAQEYGESLQTARRHAGESLLERLRQRGMSVADAIEYPSSTCSINLLTLRRRPFRSMMGNN